jgi:aconitase A
VRYTIERDGFIGTFEQLGTKIFTNACGPCIGQWDREGAEKGEVNTLSTRSTVTLRNVPMVTQIHTRL